MKKSRFSESQIVAILKEVELGAKVGETCRRKLPRQVDRSEVETAAGVNLGLNTAGGTLPRDSCGRYSL